MFNSDKSKQIDVIFQRGQTIYGHPVLDVRLESSMARLAKISFRTFFFEECLEDCFNSIEKETFKNNRWYLLYDYEFSKRFKQFLQCDLSLVPFDGSDYKKTAVILPTSNPGFIINKHGLECAIKILFKRIYQLK